MLNAKEIGIRIRSLRGELSLRDFAQKCGISHTTIDNLEKGIDFRTGKPTQVKMVTLQKIATACNTPLDYLLGREQISDSEQDVLNLYEYFPNIFKIEKKKFPLLGEIACGEPIFADEDNESFIIANADIKADFCLRCKGDSMINARIHDGDIVFIRKQPMVDNGEIAAVIIDDEATLKRVYYTPNEEKLVLVPENSKYAPIVYTGSQLDTVRILGKAVMANIRVK